MRHCRLGCPFVFSFLVFYNYFFFEKRVDWDTFTKFKIFCGRKMDTLLESDEFGALFRSMRDYTSRVYAKPELAAPQMGVNVRLMNHPKTSRVWHHVLVNPKERKRSRKTVIGPETSI